MHIRWHVCVESHQAQATKMMPIMLGLNIAAFAYYSSSLLHFVNTLDHLKIFINLLYFICQ